MDTPSVANDTETAVNKVENIRRSRNGVKIEQNSLAMPEIEIERSELASRWRRVGARDISVYALWNAPVKVSKTVDRTFAFGQVESGDEELDAVEVIAPSVDDEGAGDGDRDKDGDDDGEDGVASSSTRRLDASQGGATGWRVNTAR